MGTYALLTVAFAGLVQSGFSLGVSLLTLLGGHSLSRRRSHRRLLWLSGGFVAGSFAMTLLLALALTYACLFVSPAASPLWQLALGTVTVLVGLWVTFFYYRRGAGTSLRLPRSFARYLTERTAHTRSASESFVLGGASVLYELPVVLWLLLIVAGNVPYVTIPLQVPVLIGYAVLATASLALVFALIGGGHTTAALTRFRERYKRFLQVLVGLSIVLLGTSLFLNNYYAVQSFRGLLPW